MAYVDIADKATLDIIKINTDSIKSSSSPNDIIVNNTYSAGTISSSVESELISVSGSGQFKSLRLYGFNTATLTLDGLVTKIINKSSSTARTLYILPSSGILAFRPEDNYSSYYTAPHLKGYTDTFNFSKLRNSISLGSTIEINIDDDYNTWNGALMMLVEPIKFKNNFKLTSSCLSGKTLSLDCAYSI